MKCEVYVLSKYLVTGNSVSKRHACARGKCRVLSLKLLGMERYFSRRCTKRERTEESPDIISGDFWDSFYCLPELCLFHPSVLEIEEC